MYLCTVDVDFMSSAAQISLTVGEQIKSALANEEAKAEQPQQQTLPQQGDISGFPFFGFGG